MSGRDDDDRPERPRRSWRDIDRMRDGARDRSRERGPRGPAAEARAKSATQEYLKQLDGLFSSAKGGAEGERLAQAVRQAHGTDQLAEACRAYRSEVGIPTDPSLISLFLDAADREIVLAALESLIEIHSKGGAKISSGLRSQLRILAEGSDDSIAGAAEDLLASL